MNTKPVKTFILLSSIFIISGCSATSQTTLQNNNNEPVSTQTVTDTNYTAYSNKTYGFNLQVPKDWIVDEQSKYGIVTIKNSLKDLVTGGPFGTNIIVNGEDTQGADLSAYLDFERKNLVDTDKTYKITKDVSLKNGKAQLLEGTFQFEKWNLQQKVYITSKNGKFFILLATAPAEIWNKYETTFDKVLNSFE